MKILLKTFIFILSVGISTGAFAAAKITTESVSSHAEESKGVDITINTGVLNNTRGVESKTETDSSLGEEKKDKEKTINDINNFLIESYKIKIDKILTNLNISIERITNNDPVAQAKLLEKIRGDISVKIEIINSRTISENRKKILSSVFSYIQENLDAKISKLVGQK